MVHKHISTRDDKQKNIDIRVYPHNMLPGQRFHWHRQHIPVRAFEEMQRGKLTVRRPDMIDKKNTNSILAYTTGSFTQNKIWQKITHINHPRYMSCQFCQDKEFVDEI